LVQAQSYFHYPVVAPSATLTGRYLLAPGCLNRKYDIPS